MLLDVPVTADSVSRQSARRISRRRGGRPLRMPINRPIGHEIFGVLEKFGKFNTNSVRLFKSHQ